MRAYGTWNPPEFFAHTGEFIKSKLIHCKFKSTWCYSESVNDSYVYSTQASTGLPNYKRKITLQGTPYLHFPTKSKMILLLDPEEYQVQTFKVCLNEFFVKCNFCMYLHYFCTLMLQLTSYGLIFQLQCLPIKLRFCGNILDKNSNKLWRRKAIG